MAVLKQSTAYTRMFLMVQTADHLTGATGAAPTVNLSKAGAAFSAAGGTVTEVSSGWYKIALNTTDTGTLGDLAYHITGTSADPTDFVDQVTSNIFGDTLPANVTQWNGTNVSSPATAGIPDVNVKNFNNVAAGSLPSNFSSLVINGSGAVSVQSNVKKNAGLNNFPFTMTDSTTHSPTTGKTVTCSLSLDGAAFSASTNSPSEVGNGDYKINLAAADTNANTVMMRFTATGCDDLNIILITDP